MRDAPIVIAAGGTGGHFFPAEALAVELLARGRQVVLLTDARAGALNSSAFAGQRTHVIAGAGIAGRGLIRGIRAALSMSRGVAQAWRIIARARPAAVVGFGGYPCVAPVLAASLRRPRPVIVLHEQNAVLGRANRALAGRCDLLALSLPGTTRLPSGIRHELVGNPVRPAIAALAGQSYVAPGEHIQLLVLGGSLGARAFSDVVPPALALLAPGLRGRLRVTQQCRAEDLERVRAAYAGTGIHAEQASFFSDMPALLARAHLVIARAGASTVAELAVAGRPAILVPLPGAIDDHQSANARGLADAGAAWLLAQAQFSAPALAALLTELLSAPARLVAAAQAAAAQGRPHAAAALADATLALLRELPA